MNLSAKAKTIGVILLVTCLLAVPVGTVLAEMPGNPRKPECEVGLDKEWPPPHGDGEWVSPCGFISLERGGVAEDVVKVKVKVEGDSMFVLVSTEGGGIVAIPIEEFDVEVHDAILAESMQEAAISGILGVDDTVQIKSWEIVTRNTTWIRTFKSLLGVPVARHYAHTTWTCSPHVNFMWSGPRSLNSDWWTLPPTFMTSYSETWDWFHTGFGGTGRANHHMAFVFGVPTPWGPIGSTFSSRIWTLVRADGTDTAW